ncbi:MAG: hypothetical protein MJ223_02820 [Mycoplasmoidaceae bacterium]|nr:hypothetical protein [Mycoplasmoidaceae bacterium]
MIELAVLAVFGVVSAGFGVRDDGIKFKNSIKLLAAKMFSIVICYACFVVGITLLTTITHSFNNLGESGLTEGMLKVILMAGGLIGAYHIANAISKQFGDSHSLQETMGDIGLIKTAMGAAGGGLMLMGLKKGAMAGGKKAFGGIKGGIRGKYMSGVQNITDRKMKLALNEGLVKREHKIGADGKSHQVFSFKDKGSQVTQDRYNQIMNMSKKDLRRAEMSAAAKSSAKTAAKASAQQAKSSAQSLKANASAE